MFCTYIFLYCKFLYCFYIISILFCTYIFLYCKYMFLTYEYVFFEKTSSTSFPCPSHAWGPRMEKARGYGAQWTPRGNGAWVRRAAWTRRVGSTKCMPKFGHHFHAWRVEKARRVDAAWKRCYISCLTLLIWTTHYVSTFFLLCCLNTG